MYVGGTCVHGSLTRTDVLICMVAGIKFAIFGFNGAGQFA